MNSFYLETAKKHGANISIGLVCLVVLVLSDELPLEIKEALQTSLGRVVLVLLIGVTFATAHPFVGALSILAFWRLNNITPYKTVQIDTEEELEKQQNEEKVITATDMPLYNEPNAIVSSDIGGTLEEEIIAKMAPKKQNKHASTGSYVPILDTSITASELGEA